MHIHSQTAESLREAWQASRRGGPELVLLEGAAGLGKSHLLRDLARAAAVDTGTVLIVRSDPLREVLQGQLGLLESRDAALIAAGRPFLPEHPWPNVVGRPSREAPDVVIARALSDTVTTAAPLLLLLEDVHRYSGQAQAFVQALWSRLLLGARPALLVLTTRPLPEHPAAQDLQRAVEHTSQMIRGAPCRREVLCPTDRAGIEALAESHLAGHVPEPLTAWLLDRTGGHPLTILEVLRLLWDVGALRRGASGWKFTPPPEGAVPTALTAAILSRLQSVPAASGPGRLLAALAVLDTADERTWQAVAQVNAEVFHAAAAWLQHRDFVRLAPGGGAPTYTWGHPLYGPLMQADLPWPEVTELHRRAAGLAHLEAVARARHARRAETPDAAQLTRQAVHAAAARGAHSDVIQEARALLAAEPGDPDVTAALIRALSFSGALQEVLDLTDTLAPAAWTPRLYAARAQALMELGQLAAAQAFARDALTRVPPATLEEELLEDVLFRAMIHDGQLDEAERGLTQALASLGEGRVGRHMLLLELTALARHRRGDYAGTLRLAREAVHVGQAGQLFESLDPRDAEQGFWALNSAGGSAIHFALWDEAAAHLTAARELVVRHAMTSRLMLVEGNLAYIHLMRGEYPEAEASSWTQLRRAEQSGNARVHGALMWNVGICRLWRGDPAQALTLMQRSAELWPSVGSANATDFAEALAFQGRLDEARQMLGETDHDYYCEHPSSRARVHLLLGEPDAALRETERTRPEDGAGTCARSALVRAQAYLMTGDEGAAERALDDARTLAAAGHLISVQAELQLTDAVLQRRAGRDSAQRVWADGQRSLLATDGRGHLQFVRTLFPAETAALSAVPDAPPPAARLRLFGPLHLEQAGSVRPWKARKVKELLAHLVCAHYGEGSGTLSRDALMLALWPDADQRSAEYNFQKTLTRLRDTLQGAALITRDPQGRYGLQAVHADVDDFLAALHAGRYCEAAQQVTAPFLADVDLDAAAALRDALNVQWRDAALTLALTDAPAAAPHLARCVAQDPLDLEATVALLQVYRTCGDLREHVRCLTRARQAFLAAVGEVPAELRRAQREAGEPDPLTSLPLCPGLSGAG
ncbi:AAA family ATPase [Deinococcus radiotolerans]|uniref:AAA+ ATPase domain-containing protein n=1 Tax=Deinococcus radiotolerans TaxID=1309407 RepID=A0ABQ2FPE3_9DEIO|nr:AAA family ATPase [Deinococcus radiotolerans]GGL13622.1 hypothetical protein GCM10010844_35640 [Deinococcus radiotolerans]